MNSKADLFDRIVEEISRFRIPIDTEAAMQSAIERVLTNAGIDCRREVILSAKDRIDFMVEDIGIECKISGANAAVSSQIARYFEHSVISSLILVTGRASHYRIGYECGKRFHVLVVSGL